MKRLVKHSPDFFEALVMRMYFEINHQAVKIPSWVRISKQHNNIIIKRYGFEPI